jgi:hypothetical protein
MRMAEAEGAGRLQQAGLLMVSGGARLIEFWIAQAQSGVSEELGRRGRNHDDTRKSFSTCHAAVRSGNAGCDVRDDPGRSCAAVCHSLVAAQGIHMPAQAGSVAAHG